MNLSFCLQVTAAMLKHIHMTPRRACAVIHLWKAGLPYSKIASNLGVAKSTICRTLQRAQENPDDPTATRQCSGRPSKLSLEDEIALVNAAVENRGLSTKELCKQFKCCSTTLKKVLDKHGYHKRVARRKPYLKDSHKEARLHFAKAHKHWKAKHWERVMFTDECNIELGLDGRVYWIWRRADESLTSNCLKPTFKSGRTSVGIWSSIFKNMKGPLILIEGRMTGQQYVE
jgi:transposase